MDEYLALNVIFVALMLFYFHKLYGLIANIVSIIESEFQNNPYTIQNPLLNTPSMEIPPPPPPIPDEWFEENQMWNGN